MKDTKIAQEEISSIVMNSGLTLKEAKKVLTRILENIEILEANITLSDDLVKYMRK